MKIEIVKLKHGEWKLNIVQGVQSFELSYRGSKKECEWVSSMFYFALKKHNNELDILKLNQ